MSSPKRQKPNKVLGVRVTAKTDLDSWQYEDYPGDPWWAGGPLPKPYRWEITLSLTSQRHGDSSTREPFAYNGIDLYVGDWIADTESGISLKITNVLEKSFNSATIVVEDIDRYNTFMDENGSGIFQVPVDGIIFEISDQKQPILNPLPSDISSFGFANEVTARFQNNNPLYRYRFHQSNVGLSDNDSVWVDPADGLVKTVSDDNSLKRMIGTVDRVGPGDDVFYIIPTTKIVEGIDPPLPGTAGLIIYTEPFTGELTTTPTETTKAAYIQVTNSTPDTTSGNNDNVVANEVVAINDVAVTFTGNTLTAAVGDINALSLQHRVVSSENAGSASSSTNSSLLSYPQIYCRGLTTEITLNGTSIVFDDDTHGQTVLPGGTPSWVDIVNSINSAGITDIVASYVSDTYISITNSAGGPVDIVNIASDSRGAPFASDNNPSSTGLPLSATVNPGYLSFVNDLGSGIIFKSVTGTPVLNLGLVSVRNGELPKGLVVEQYTLQGTGPGGVTVYADIPSLPSVGTVGEQAYVIDSDDGSGTKENEWTMFLWDGFQWIKTSDEDSAATDANSAELVITPATTAQEIITRISNNSRVSLVTIDVNIPFDGNATITVGDNIVNNRLMNEDDTDLAWQSTYVSTSDYLYNVGQDTDITAYFNAGGATVGEATIVISYQ